MTWQQPPYQPPEYPYGQYGQPPLPPPLPAASTTSGMATASLVLGILGFCGISAVLSLIFGFIGLGQTKAGAQKGRGMAISGIVLSIVWIVVIALVAIFGSFRTDRDVRVTEIKVGDCIETTPADNARIRTVPKVDCSKPHQAEVYAVLPVSGDKFPGQAALEDEYMAKCETAITAYSPQTTNDSGVRMYVIFPSQRSWDEGDRLVTCMATTTDKRTGSIKG